MDYHFNNNPIIDGYNMYNNNKLKKQYIQNDNNMDIFRNNSILKEKLISKKYRTAKNSAKKQIEDSAQYINEKSNDYFEQRVKKIYSKKTGY